MAMSKSSSSTEGDAQVTPHKDAGVGALQVKPTADLSAKEIKASIVHAPDRELHPTGEPEYEADRTSLPTAYAPIDRPPVSTTRPDEPILQSLVTGAGAHVPPDPAVYDEMGRLRD